MNITGIGHATIQVRDIGVSERFYSRVLRMPLLSRADQHAELSFGAGKSNQFVVRASPSEPEAPNARSAVHRIAFVIGNNPRTLQDAAEHLTASGIPFKQVAHDDYESLVLRDPDGHLIELYYWPEW